jgi:hypothetical protein
LIAGSSMVAAVLALAGCGGGSSTEQPSSSAPTASTAAPSPFPPRPQILSLDAADPCALLTTDQRRQLGVHQESVAASTDALGGKDCSWGSAGVPQNGYFARVITGHGAEYALGSTTGTRLVEVGGFGAVATAGAYADPNYQCVVVIDVAPGQSLYAEYGNDNKDYPGMTHELACQKATALGVTMLQNLRTLVH